MTIGHGEGKETKERLGQEGKARESAEQIYDRRGDGGDRSRLGDEEPGPGVEESRERAVSVADGNIIAAGPRPHSGKLGKGQGAKEGKQAADEPNDIHHGWRAYVLHHYAGDAKDSATDDGSDYDGDGVPNVEIANQLTGRGLLSGLHRLPCA